MKKALLVLLLLAVAGGLFAQSLTWSGFARSGLMVAVPEDDDGDTTFHAYNPDPANRLRFELNTAATTAAGNAGAAGRIRWNTALNGDRAFSFEWAYAWFRPIGDAVTNGLTIYGGRMDNNNWHIPAGFDSSNSIASDYNGALLRYDTAGLSFGLGVYPENAEVADGRYAFGVRYTSAGVFDVAANLHYNGAGNNGDGVTNVVAGVNILALSGMGLSRLAVDVRAEDLSNLSWLGIGPRIHFDVAGINTGLRSQVYLPMGDSEEDLDAAVTVWAAMPVTSVVTVRLDAGFELNAGLRAKTDVGAFDYRAWDGLPRAIGGGDDSLVIVSPSLSLNIGGGTLAAGYSLLSQLGDNSATRHAIWTTFNVGF